MAWYNIHHECLPQHPKTDPMAAVLSQVPESTGNKLRNEWTASVQKPLD